MNLSSDHYKTEAMVWRARAQAWRAASRRHQQASIYHGTAVALFVLSLIGFMAMAFKATPQSIHTITWCVFGGAWVFAIIGNAVTASAHALEPKE